MAPSNLSAFEQNSLTAHRIVWNTSNHRVDSGVHNEGVLVSEMAAGGKKSIADEGAGVCCDRAHFLHGVLFAVSHKIIECVWHVRGRLRWPLHHVRDHQFFEGGCGYCAQLF